MRASTATGAEPEVLTAESHQMLGVAIAALNAQKARFEATAFKVNGTYLSRYRLLL